jgi:hypothetical protein
MSPGVTSTAILFFAVCLSCGGKGDKERVGVPQRESLLASLPPGASNMQATRGNLDEDILEEFAVCYEESLRGVVLVIAESSFEKTFVLPVAHDRATLPRLVDIDQDGLFEVILRGPSRGGESLQMIKRGRTGFKLAGDFWGLEVSLRDEDGDGTLEVEVENRDFERDPSKHTVHTFYRWDGAAFSPFKSFRAARKFVF